MAKSGGGDRLIMIWVLADRRAWKSLVQLSAVFGRHRDAQTGQISGRMPRFIATFEHCQAVAGIGLAENQSVDRSLSGMATKQVDAASLQRLQRVLISPEWNNSHLHAEQLSDQCRCVSTYTFILIVVVNNSEWRGLSGRNTDDQFALAPQPMPVLAGYSYIVAIDA
ncbi:hypothetical protein D3C77_511560 [compost metagenome]